MEDSRDLLITLLGKMERLEQISLRASKNVLTLDEVCELTGISKNNMYKLTSEKRIPHYKQGKIYFKRNEVEEWLTSNKIPTV